MKLKDSHTQSETQNKYKQYRDLISTLLRQSKQSYFTNFFQDNVKNLKNT